jgi:hypothetical protein
VFKLDFSSLCCDPKKRHQEAFDAVALIEHAIAQQSLNSNTASATGHGQRQVTESVTNPMIQLSPRQERAVEEALCDVTWCGGRGKSWWEACLGLPRRSSARRSRINSEPGRPREVWPGGYETEAARQSRSCGIYERVADDLSAASYYERLDHPRGQLQKRSNSVGEASPEQYFYLTGKLRTWYEVYWGNIRDYWPAIADVAAAAAVPRGRSPEGRNYTTRPNLDSRSTAVNVPVNNRSHSAGSSDSGYGSYSDDQGAYPGPPKLSGGGAADRSRYHPIGGDVPSESKPCAPLETVAEVTAVGERDGDDAVDRSKDEKPGRMLRTVTFQL